MTDIFEPGAENLLQIVIKKSLPVIMKFQIPLFLFCLVMGCTPKDSKQDHSWRPLWNGKDLNGWDTYLSSPYSGISKDEEGFIGLNNPSQDIIQVVELNDEPVIRISGIAWGMMFTNEDFKNYHLKLKVKWGEGKHVPRENGPRDSGLLYHGYGEPGSAYVWMASQELQIQEGDMGDYWPTGDIEIDVPCELRDSLFYTYHEEGDLRTFYFADILDTDVMDSLSKRRVIKSMDAEKPHGQWNDVELICYGDSSIHIVNDLVLMRLYNSRKMSDKTPVAKGKIILQSEGAEVFYKDIEIREIDSIPEKYRENNLKSIQ